MTDEEIREHEARLDTAPHSGAAYRNRNFFFNFPANLMKRTVTIATAATALQLSGLTSATDDNRRATTRHRLPLLQPPTTGFPLFISL